MAEEDFFRAARHDFLRVAACTPAVVPADPEANLASVLDLARRADAEGAVVAAFPELCLSAYAIDDLLQQEVLLGAAERALLRLCEASREIAGLLFVGAPLVWRGRLYNCAAAVLRGRILGVTPKSFLPSYREFYERRWFAPGAEISGAEISIGSVSAPFGTDLLFRLTGEARSTVHVEICEDLWTAEPPSGPAARAGAEILLNLSASNIVIGKAETRRLLARAQSARCLAAYVYAAAGPGESTTDLAFDGQTGVFELGETLLEGDRFREGPHQILADVDLGRIRADRLRQATFAEAETRRPFRVVEAEIRGVKPQSDLRRRVPRYPFVPADPERLRADCEEAWSIQVQGLSRRLRSAGLGRLVIGVSGGLDSTQALVVCAKVMDELKRPRSDVLAFTLPGFATSAQTRANAHALMRGLGVTAKEIDITPLASRMLEDLGHPAARGEPVYDVTFENVQAGLRTDLLFRLANQAGALVVGTGDLSELGLGWCTYGVGDQMSHYNPNGSVAKTLIQHLIRFTAREGGFSEAVSRTLEAVLATEISPELVPGTLAQSTEAAVGPYALQDFNLFHMTRYGFRPSKIAFLAHAAWSDATRGDWPEGAPAGERRAYDLAEIKRWLRLFLVRFFANQFKRSALPNGPKITSGGSLSPRGDWRMPSDASAAAWLAELEANVPDAA